MPGMRKEKVAEAVQEEVARLLTAEVHYGRLGFVTVTGVTMSGDLRHARILVSTLEEGERREALLKALELQKGSIRRQLGRALRLRYTPEISFHLDTTLETSARIDRLLDDIRKAEPISPDPADSPGDDEDPRR